MMAITGEVLLKFSLRSFKTSLTFQTLHVIIINELAYQQF